MTERTTVGSVYTINRFVTVLMKTNQIDFSSARHNFRSLTDSVV